MMDLRTVNIWSGVSRGVCVVALALAIVVPSEPTRAGNCTWNNAGGGSFSTPGYWTPSGPPGSSDYAYFKVAATYGVTLAGSTTIGRLYVGDAFAGPQTVTLSGNTLNASYAYVGSNSGSNSNVILEGNTTILSTAPTNTWEDGIQISGTTNSLAVKNNAQATTTGVARLTGTGNSIQVDNATLTATGGTSRSVTITGTNNQLSVLNGGTVSAPGRYVVIGDGAGVTGASLSLTGGTVQGGRVYIGTGGASGGSAVVTGSGSLLDGIGTYGTMSVGDSSNNNTLTVSNGATARATLQLFIGAGTGSGNQVTVTGSGSKLQGNNTPDYQTAIEFGGTSNTLTVETGGTVSTGGGELVLFGTNNKLEVKGGTVTVNGPGGTGIGLNCNTYYGSTSGSGATLTMDSGTITTNGNISVAGGSFTQTGGTASATRLLAGTYGANGTTTTISGAATTLTTSHPNASGILVGNSANSNTLTISGGATASAAYSVQVGAGTGSGNLMVVTGTSSKLEAKNVNNWQEGLLLDGSSNTLRIETGATASTKGGQIQIFGTNNKIEVAGGTLSAPGSYIGLNCNPYYRSTSGSGATLTMSSGTIAASQIAVGGGSFTQTGGTTTVSSLLAGTYGANGSTTTISGASTTLTASGNVTVGYDNSPGVGSVNNTLKVENGAQVSVQDGGIVGSSSGGGSKLVVTGANSTFASGLNGQFWSSWLKVGPAGAGSNTVQVSNGGTLSTIGMVVNNTAGNAITNTGGVYEFRVSKMLLEGGTISLTDGTISYKGITDANVKANTLPYVSDFWSNTSIANIVFAGNNTFMMNNSTSQYGGDQTYTYDSVANTGNAKNYQRLVMVNGTTAIPLGNLTIGSGGAMLADNTTASITQSMTNRGALTVDSDATLSVGTFSQTAGSAMVNGTLTSINAASISGGLLNGSGTISAPALAVSNATVSIGNSPGTLTVSGAYSQASSVVLLIELAGLNQGVSYDWLNVGGAATLAGTLSVTPTTSPWFLDYGQTFTVLTAVGGITNNGLVLGGPHMDWFRMSVGPNNVVLTSMIPEPASALLLGLAGLALLRRRR